MDLYHGKGTTYRYYSGKPTIPFGFGLSYSTFEYKNLRLNATTIGHCDSVSVSVDVTNTGAVDSDEVVQMYVKTPDASVKAPRVRLADFERVAIPKGSTVMVSLTLAPKYTLPAMQYMCQRARVRIPALHPPCFIQIFNLPPDVGSFCDAFCWCGVGISPS
jgi:hypothetical protein